MKIDLNADAGEGYDDTPLLPLVSSVNIACGAHAGDAETIARTIEAARAHGVVVGAHPGYADREHFGRRALAVPLTALKHSLLEQLELLYEIADKTGTAVEHVKPHGALYNQASDDPILAMMIAETVVEFDRSLRLIGRAASALPAAGAELGLAVGEEAFADRAYRSDGRLAPRDAPGALITDPRAAAAQALAIARREPFPSIDGTSITLRADTICCHGDSPDAVTTARAVRDALRAAGIEVAPL